MIMLPVILQNNEVLIVQWIKPITHTLHNTYSFLFLIVDAFYDILYITTAGTPLWTPVSIVIQISNHYIPGSNKFSNHNWKQTNWGLLRLNSWRAMHLWGWCTFVTLLETVCNTLSDSVLMQVCRWFYSLYGSSSLFWLITSGTVIEYLWKQRVWEI